MNGILPIHELNMNRKLIPSINPQLMECPALPIVTSRVIIIGAYQILYTCISKRNVQKRILLDTLLIPWRELPDHIRKNST
jgi:hypothetical protein